MSNARNLADLLDSTGDVKSDALDNVPAADVVNDTTPQLGGDLDTNGNNINFGDNDKAQFGASNDLQIYHDGSNSIINETGTGVLEVRTNGTEVQLTGNSGAEYMLRALSNGAVNLYYDNSKKLETTSGGVTVTGTVSATAFSGDGSSLTGVGGETKAWVVFNQSSNTIADSYGISSVSTGVTSSETGRSRINFSTSFANTNYCMVSGAGESNGVDGYGMALKETSYSYCEARNQPDWSQSFGWTTRASMVFMGDQ